MTKPAFTPGPWEVRRARTPDNTGGFDYAIGASGKVIAEAFEHVGWGDETTYDKRPAEANANLIAAAPRLYSALTQALGIIVEFGNLNGFRNMSNEELGKCVQSVARECAEALTQARGEAGALVHMREAAE